ncbi:hypothetical protein [Deinococcus peraridilitoris]|uniref:Uncharacterized protein n=1 Tax=Deinococcus peraridilitoris (strain DSM 19664 / LMG 22246 / CIP 109416 / KR-200) TaxID=937777 RepID=L0A0C7_DEIPD|nr:hypothetical protein [Deinococcus peraridilitoris]AFZ66602.1 hypothetical protein Deipe_1038 [Deinococcus peraridilitoris DSM 19664]
MDKQGIRFAIDGVDELTFFKVLRDVVQDPLFAKPLQVLAQAPKGEAPGRVTIAFDQQDRTQAVNATQRLKTIMLRYGVQVDSVRS